MGRLDNRVAIVTGASRGLGKSIAELFASEGAAVAVVARTETQWDPRLPGTVHETVAAIQAAGGTAVAVPADLARPDEVETIVDRTTAALGPVDILVNNAALTVPGRPGRGGRPGPSGRPDRPGRGDRPGPSGRPDRPGPLGPSGPSPVEDAGAEPVTAPSPPPVPPVPPPVPGPSAISRSSFLAFPLKGFRLHFEIGLMATYRLMQLVLPGMIEAGKGSIVNISSLAAYVPGPGPYPSAPTVALFGYGGNKAALHHLTQAVASEMQQHGIAVNALMPSEPVLSPGNLYAGAGDVDYASPDRFAEATVQVALADPQVTNGLILWSEDVLQPELGRRGWLRTPSA